MAPLFRRKADDDKAFERLYERHVRDVYRYSFAMLGEAADAEDVTQTTFLNAYRSFQRGTRPDKPRSWLIAIAHNVCRQRFRQAQRRPREVEFDERLAEGSVVEDAGAPSAQDLRRALSELPPNQRAALVMRELEGSSYAEIAAVLGISVSALETLLFRARRALREQLEEHLTCEEAAFAIHKQLEGRLPMSERRGLRAHLRACPECTSLAQSQRAQRRALKSLVLVPLPSGLPHWFGHSTATGAAGAAGAGGLTVAAATGGGAAGAGAGASTAILGGVAAKAAAVVAVGAVVGGGYAGAKLVVLPAVHAPSPPAAKAAAANSAPFFDGAAARTAAAFDASRLLVPRNAPGSSAPRSARSARGGQSAQAHRAAETHRAAQAHGRAAQHAAGTKRPAASARARAEAPGQLKKATAEALIADGAFGSVHSRAARTTIPGRSAKAKLDATGKAAHATATHPQGRTQQNKPTKTDATTKPAPNAPQKAATTTPTPTHPAPDDRAGGKKNKKKTTDTTATTETTATTDTTVTDPAVSDPAQAVATGAGAHPSNEERR